MILQKVKEGTISLQKDIADPMGNASKRKCIVKLSVKVRLEKQMVVKLEQKWKPKDNVCLLFALWGMMSFDANPFLK